MRFQRLDTLGEGGQGQVMLARDAEREGLVAIKRVRDAAGTALLRFKAEFRAVSELRHPGLVHLYELGQDNDGVYFTMEVIDGVTLGVYLRGGPQPGRAAATITSADGSFEADTEVRPIAGPPPLEDILARLAPVVPQILDALAALHDHGLVHRDLKPSNVMVTRDGAVKLLDFGILAELGATAEMVGTPAYMAPEQIDGGVVSPASDLYALGVILYQAIAGRFPFLGTRLAVMEAHRSTAPIPLATLVPEVPAPLAEACARLLEKRPDRRPDLAWLERHLLAPLGWPGLAPRADPRDAVLIGRTALQERLIEALEGTVRRVSGALVLRGPSGIGKSRLVDWLAGEARARGIPVLRGRARFHERVPFNALDGAIDGLARLWGDVEDPRIAAMQRTAATAFPVFQQDQRVSLRQPTRGEAFAAIAGLLADAGNVLIAVDDLQWADADSLALLESLVAGAPRGVLMVGTLRDEAEHAPVLARLSRLSGLEMIAVPPLAPHDVARVIAQAARRRGMTIDTQDVTPLVEQCDGRAMIAEVIGRGLAARARPGRGALVALLDAVPEKAHAILAALEAADQTVPLDLLARVVEQTAGEVEDQLAELHEDGLVRKEIQGGQTVLELYHDVVRAAVHARLDAEVARHAHDRFATLLGADPSVAPERVVRHLLGAGRTVEVGHRARDAAERARGRFAYDLAAEMYEIALDAGGADRVTLLRQLATCLDAGARYRKAAVRWRELAELVPPDERAEIAVHEAASLLGGADLKAGHARLDEALRALGAPPLRARGPGALFDAVRFLIGPRAPGRLALPAGDEVDPTTRSRLDRDIHLAMLAGYFDPLSGVRWMLRTARVCRRSGAVEDLASCNHLLAFMAYFSNPRRGPLRLGERYRAAAGALTQRLPELRASTRSEIRTLDAVELLRAGQFEGAGHALDEALAILEDGGIHGTIGHLFNLILRCTVELARQRIGPLQQQHRRLVAAMTEVDSTAAAAQVAVFDAARAWLSGARDEGRRILDDLAAVWPADPPTAQHCLVGFIQGLGDMGFVAPAESRVRIRAVMAADRRFRLLSSFDAASYWSIIALIEARAVLAGDRRASRRAVDRFAARALAAPPLGATRALRARAYVARDPARGIELLAAAEREALLWNQRIDVAVARHQRGKRLGGDEGARLRGEAVAILIEAGVPGHWMDEDEV